MRIAIPVYQGRVSPLFDAASTVRLVEVLPSGWRDRGPLLVEGMTPVQRVELLRRLEVEVLVCAGITAMLRSLLLGAGIRVVDGVVGRFEEVVEAFRVGGLAQPRFRMPGRGRMRWRHGRGGGFGRGPGWGR